MHSHNLSTQVSALFLIVEDLETLGIVEPSFTSCRPLSPPVPKFRDPYQVISCHRDHPGASAVHFVLHVIANTSRTNNY
jgi:hypothetical protein